MPGHPAPRIQEEEPSTQRPGDEDFGLTKCSRIWRRKWALNTSIIKVMWLESRRLNNIGRNNACE